MEGVAVTMAAKLHLNFFLFIPQLPAYFSYLETIISPCLR